LAKPAPTQPVNLLKMDLLGHRMDASASFWWGDRFRKKPLR
jgi:hypothetical protein